MQAAGTPNNAPGNVSLASPPGSLPCTYYMHVEESLGTRPVSGCMLAWLMCVGVDEPYTSIYMCSLYREKRDTCTEAD